MAFSIIIPTYQRREIVCDTVRALFNLHCGGSVDVIVVVDGSADGTVEALRQLECPFPLHIVEQENRGAAYARNRGADLAKGEILLFLDDDMIAEADLIEQHARMYREGADAVTGEVFLDSNSPRNFITESVERWISLPRSEVPQLPFHVYTGQLSVRRSVFFEIGGFDEAFTSDGLFAHEDTDFGVKLLSKYSLRHNAQALTHQRYSVGPRESMYRVKALAAADVRFLRKYPQFTDYLAAQRGHRQWKTRLVYLPLSRIPFAIPLMMRLAASLAEAAVKSRFRSNRFLRYFFFAARGAAYWSAVRAAGDFPSSQSLLVLCYHAIRDQSADPVLAPYGVSPSRFDEQLQSLARRGFTFVGPDTVAGFLGEQTPLPRRAVLLTFDDCYEELLDISKGMLRPRGIHAVAFPVTGTTSGTNEWDQAEGAETLRLLTPEQLCELRSLGVEIGGHSRTHRPMPLLGKAEKEMEARGVCEDLVTRGLPRPRFFAYPYGASDQGTIQAVVNAGYMAAFGIRMRRVDRTSEPFDLPRVPVLSSDNSWRFWLKTASPKLFEWVDINLRRASKIFSRVAAARLA